MKARDLVIECFMAAQRETFTHTKEKLGLAVDGATLERSVVGAVRVAFRKTGGDFDEPTAPSLLRAVDALAATASSWGTPENIIEHHHAEIEKVLALLRA